MQTAVLEDAGCKLVVEIVGCVGKCSEHEDFLVALVDVVLELVLEVVVQELKFGVVGGVISLSIISRSSRISRSALRWRFHVT